MKAEPRGPSRTCADNQPAPYRTSCPHPTGWLLGCCFLFSAWLQAADPWVMTRGAFQQTLILNGRLEAAEAEIFFVPKTQNWQAKIQWLAEEGSEVAPGDAVVRFDDSGTVKEIQRLTQSRHDKQEERLRVITDGENKLLDLDQEIEEARLQRRIAAIDAAVPENLLEARKYQENQLALHKAENRLKTAEFNKKHEEANIADSIRRADLELNMIEKSINRALKARAMLELRTVNGGTVLYRNLRSQRRKPQVGDNLQAATPILSIPNPDKLRVLVHIGEEDLSTVKPGLRAQMNPDAFPDVGFDGTLTSVSNQGITRKQWGRGTYFAAYIQPEKTDDLQLLPGMSIKTRITITELDNVLLAPIQTVGQRNGRFLLKPRKGDPIEIKPLGFNAFHVALSDSAGLREGLELQAFATEDEDPPAATGEGSP